MHAPSRSLSELPPSTPSGPPQVGAILTSCWAETIKPPATASSRPGRTHQRSRTAVDLPPLAINTSRSSIFLPFKSSQKSRSPSPPKSPTREVDDLDFADEERSGIRLERKGNKLASWFNGTSEPIALGLLPSPIKEEQKEYLEEMMDSTRESEVNLTGPVVLRPTNRLQKRNSDLDVKPQLGLAARGLSWLKSKPTPDSPSQQDVTDELTKLDISAALFPAGPNDEFSPSAFKNLQMNAEGTIRKFQTALNQSLQSLHEIRSERNVQRDELEASQTRSEHLKLQLEEMAEKAAQQEKAMRDLTEELAAERRIRLEEEAYRGRSLRMIPTSNPDSTFEMHSTTPTTTNKRHNRVSDSLSINESEIDSEVSSSAGSIFSRPDHAPASVLSSTPSTPYEQRSPEIAQVAKMTRPQLLVTPQHHHHPTDRTPTLTTFTPEFPSPTTRRVAEECQICHGVPSSEAWDVLTILKDESKGLKETISQLEGGLDSTLDFLAGLV